MKRSKVNPPILLTTLYLFVYLIVIYYFLNFRIALFMFSLSPIVLIWMVIRILKGAYTGTKTFDESFYEDYSGKSEVIK